MTTDKLIHYINSTEIVQAINNSSADQLKQWLKDMNDHINIYHKTSIPIHLVAERKLIELRLS